MTEHTPGPWEWVQDRFWGGYSGIVNSAGDEVLFPNTSNDGDTGAAWFEDGLTEANAQLIAAAPELLEALAVILPVYTEMVNECGHDPSVGIDCSEDFARIEKAEAAIAKAKGET